MSSLLSWMGFKKKDKYNKKGDAAPRPLDPVSTSLPANMGRGLSAGALCAASPAASSQPPLYCDPSTGDPTSPTSDFGDAEQSCREQLDEARATLREMVLDTLYEQYESFTAPLPVSIACATFNVGEKIPRSSPEYVNWLTGSAADGDVDLIAVGLQEVDMSAGSIILEEQSPKYTVWEGFIAQQLDRVGEPNQFSKIGSVSMAGLLLLIFARERIAEKCSNLGTSVVRIGDRGYANKGAVAVRLTVAGRRVLFVNSHLDAHTEKLHRRNKGYARILSEMRFSRTGEKDCVDLLWPANPVRPPASHFPPSCVAKLFPTDLDVPHGEGFEYDDAMPSPSDSIRSGRDGADGAPPRGGEDDDGDQEEVFLHDFDYVFWFGDLNYRLWNVENDVVRRMVAEKKLDELSKFDQLKQAIETDTAFSGFEEAKITFPPTYKYDCGTDNYDTSAKQRVPSWTDRVLFLSRATALFPPARHGNDAMTSPSNAVPIGLAGGQAYNQQAGSYAANVGVSHLSFYSCNESLMAKGGSGSPRMVGSYLMSLPEGSHTQHMDVLATVAANRPLHGPLGSCVSGLSGSLPVGSIPTKGAVRAAANGAYTTSPATTSLPLAATTSLPLVSVPSALVRKASRGAAMCPGECEGSGEHQHVFIEGLPPHQAGAHGAGGTGAAALVGSPEPQELSPTREAPGKPPAGQPPALPSFSPAEYAAVVVKKSVEYLLENPVGWITHSTGMMSVYTAPEALQNLGVKAGMRLAEIEGRHPRDPTELNTLLLQLAAAAGGKEGKELAVVSMCFDVPPPPPLYQNVLQPLPGTYRAHHITLSDHRPVSTLFRIFCTDFDLDKAEEHFHEPKRNMASTAAEISDLLAKQSRLARRPDFPHRRYDSQISTSACRDPQPLRVAVPKHASCPVSSSAFGEDY
eukprot:TRINITY_DN3828_c0_g1_i1.p1 TRINITY_DN3828_c0_g1~~TRINITY_DN3828_c0_g1_i1.p1  ORF type:complete len:913 (+),score=308.21 TRINITY_DN3828_c0_g1_i1:145-2883(+)